MNKKLIALAVSGAALSTGASAVELYNNDGTTFSMGGHVSVALSSHAGKDGTVDAAPLEEVGITSVSPRINFNATHDIGNGFTVDAKGEWAMNLLDGDTETFTTRLGYIGATHDSYGRLVAGTQWAPYYDVAGVADMPIAFANDFIYDDHGNLGTGRAENMLSYRNGLEFGNNMALNAGIAWQGASNGTAKAIYDDRYQIALSLDIADFTLGYVNNSGDVDKEAATSNLFSAKYGAYGNGLYVAGVYGLNENMNGVEESTVSEFLVAYAFANSLNVSVNYENVEDTKENNTERSESAIQAEYNFTNKFVGFTGYQFDLEGDDNKWMLGARYYL